MVEGGDGRYWCHMCCLLVNPIILGGIEMNCPFCQSGFVEEIGYGNEDEASAGLFHSDGSVSLWAPILRGMIHNPRRRRRSWWQGLEEIEDEIESHWLDGDLESIVQRRRRGPAAILQLIQGIEGEEGADRVILISPLNQTISIHGSGDTHHQGSDGDYFVGPGLDLLLQYLTDNDPNTYGTPPTLKAAVEAMPTVKILHSLDVQCSVCLNDFEKGAQVKEMPCNHKFHSGCIMPWLELHSSCPVCRFQMPAEEFKVDCQHASHNIRSNNGIVESNQEIPGSGVGVDNENGRRFSIPWPFSGLFSSRTGGGNSSASSSSNVPDS